MIDPDLSNLDRRHRGLPPEYYGTTDPHGWIALFWVLLAAVAGAVVLVGLIFVAWFLWTVIGLAVTTITGGAL